MKSAKKALLEILCVESNLFREAIDPVDFENMLGSVATRYGLDQIGSQQLRKDALVLLQKSFPGTVGKFGDELSKVAQQRGFGQQVQQTKARQSQQQQGQGPSTKPPPLPTAANKPPPLPSAPKKEPNKDFSVNKVPSLNTLARQSTSNPEDVNWKSLGLPSPTSLKKGLASTEKQATVDAPQQPKAPPIKKKGEGVPWAKKADVVRLSPDDEESPSSNVVSIDKNKDGKSKDSKKSRKAAQEPVKTLDPATKEPIPASSKDIAATVAKAEKSAEKEKSEKAKKKDSQTDVDITKMTMADIDREATLSRYGQKGKYGQAVNKELEDAEDKPKKSSPKQKQDQDPAASTPAQQPPAPASTQQPSAPPPQQAAEPAKNKPEAPSTKSKDSKKKPESPNKKMTTTKKEKKKGKKPTRLGRKAREREEAKAQESGGLTISIDGKESSGWKKSGKEGKLIKVSKKGERDQLVHPDQIKKEGISRESVIRTLLKLED